MAGAYSPPMASRSWCRSRQQPGSHSCPTGSSLATPPAGSCLPTRSRHGCQRWVAADERHVEVEVAWHCAQQLRSIYHQPDHADGRRIAEKVLASFPSCPIPEIARLGRTLNQWRDAFLGYFTTSGANNGGTEAINGLIELARRVARGFRDPDNYRLRMLLIGGGGLRL
jgi:hypothetical protein